MEKISIQCQPSPAGYVAHSSEDISGEYVRAEVAEQMKSVLQEFIAWNKKYPSSEIFDYAEIKAITKELDAINEKAIKEIANLEKRLNELKG